MRTSIRTMIRRAQEFIRRVLETIRAAWRWSGENGTSIRTVIAVFVLIGLLFAIVFSNSANDRRNIRELTELIAERVEDEQRAFCLNAYDGREVDRANWHLFFNLLEVYSPDAIEGINLARSLFDENTPPFDRDSCFKPASQAVPDLVTTTAPPITNGD